jgi:hypothetical protein
MNNKRRTKKLKNKKYHGGQNAEYTAIIIEPRKHRALEFVLRNALTNLDNRWNIIVFHGNLNKEYVENILNNNLKDYKDRIKLHNLNVDDLTFYSYSALMLDKKFYDNIPTEYFLVFQTDSLIISKNKDKIYDFLKYDYVGSPWKFTEGKHENLNEQVGNGGFSLRKKSKMLEIIDKCRDSWNNDGEDRFFCMPCNNIAINKPSFEEAQKFGSETLLNAESFGIHKPWVYNSLEKVLEVFPEVNELFNTLWIDK